MRKAGVAYLVPGTIVLLVVCGAGFAAGQAVSSSPASADTSVVTITIEHKPKTVQMPGPLTTVTVAGPKTTIIRKYSTIREKPITIPERIVHTTKIVKSTTSKTKVYVTVGKGKGKGSTTTTTGPVKTDPPPKSHVAPTTSTPPVSTSSTAPGTSSGTTTAPQTHADWRHRLWRLVRRLGCGREAAPTPATTAHLQRREAICARLLRVLTHHPR